MGDSESDFDINEFLTVDEYPGNLDVATVLPGNSPQTQLVESAGQNLCSHITPVFAFSRPNIEVRWWPSLSFMIVGSYFFPMRTITFITCHCAKSESI